MKKLLSLAALLAGFSLSGVAKDGYKLQLKFNDVRDSAFFLAHYFAKPLPTIYKTDSGKLDKSGVALLKSDQKITGGMYIIMLSDRKTYFEFLLNNGDDLVINIPDSKNLPQGLTIKNSVENDAFIKYEEFVRTVGDEHQELNKKLATAKNSVDSAAIKDKMAAKMKSLIDYRNDFSAKNPNSLLAKIFKGLDLPKVPEGKHFLPNGEEDKDYAYRYYKNHYWDNFDLKDGRLINTPMYDARLSEYFEKLVLPSTDSMIKEADWILTQSKGSGDLFNYTLSWLANYSQESKVMGMDRVYVYLVDHYYAKGEAAWLSNDLLQKHLDHARELSPTLIGNMGYDITMKDTSGKKDVTVSNIKAKYKLIAMWEPTCGHCMKEIPALDSTYKAAKLKDRGVKIIGICGEDAPQAWKDFIKKHNLSEWTHMYDPEHKSNYKAWYNVRSFPTMYVLDEKGIIRGKSIDHSNIVSLIDMLERQDADKKKNSK
ncbi:MAG TPA: redoxin domain-containing protein [Chitinophagaceae bacterium]|nr:redoxin domain-containing protein [Chitinophagaceae bacterium]